MRYVAFEGGGEPVTALMGNHVQVVSGDLSEMVPYLNGDKIRVWRCSPTNVYRVS